jgi:DNA-directed RNA polymerase specialized sigma subunit
VRVKNSYRSSSRCASISKRPREPAQGQSALRQKLQLPHAGDPPDEPIAQIQRVDHESRVHIETDDIPIEVTRLEKLGAKAKQWG